MDFSDYKFHCHMVGKIINVPKPLTHNQSETLKGYTDRFNGSGKPLTTNQKETLISLQYKEIQSRNYSLSDGQKKLLCELAYAVKNNRKAVLNFDKITKGLEKEKESRDLLSRVTNLFLVANNERKINDWVTGAIDIEPNEVIPDIKTAWSWESFSKILQESANDIYLRQGDSYMDLWNKKEFLLCHVLVDTPFRLVEKEIYNRNYTSDILNIEMEVREESINEVKQIVTNHIFSRQGLEEFCDYSSNVYIEWFNDFVEIPENERVHMIPHSYDKTRIDQRNECISLAREYMNTVKPINNFKPELLAG